MENECLKCLLVVDRLPTWSVRPLYLDWTNDEETLPSGSCLPILHSVPVHQPAKHLAIRHKHESFNPADP